MMQCKMKRRRQPPKMASAACRFLLIRADAANPHVAQQRICLASFSDFGLHAVGRRDSRYG